MTNPIGRYWWQALAALSAGATAYAGIRQFFSDEVSVGASPGKVAALVFLVGAGVLTLLGLVVHRTMPRRGAGMVIAGVLPAALVGGLGIGIVAGLFASLIGDEGWWWLPVGVLSAVATAAGLGAFSAWWHAARGGAATSPRITVLPIFLVIAGLLIAGAGVSLGQFTIPSLGLGAAVALIGAAVLSRRIKTAN
jgi:hypothetical protein